MFILVVLLILAGGFYVIWQLEKHQPTGLLTQTGTKTTCPKCHVMFTVSSKAAGAHATCPSCRAEMVFQPKPQGPSPLNPKTNPPGAFGEFVYTHVLVTINRWTGAIALALAAIALFLGPLAAVAIGLNNGADGWAFIGGAFAYGVALSAVGLSAYVVAELLTMAVRVVSVLKSIDAKLGSGPLATAVPPKSDVNPDEPPKA